MIHVNGLSEQKSHDRTSPGKAAETYASPLQPVPLRDSLWGKVCY